MTEEIKHTPMPWVRDEYETLRDSNGKQLQVSNLGIATVIAGHTEETKANAAFIVRAVNSHEALVKELSRARDMLKSRGIEITSINEALALAKGEVGES